MTTEADATDLSEMEFDEISLVDRGGNQKSHVVIWKADADEAEETEMSDEATETAEAPTADLPEEVLDYIESLEGKVKELTSKLDTAEADAEVTKVEGALDEVLKSADPAVVELVKNLTERTELAETIAKAERAERLEREWIAKVDADFGHLPAEATEFGRLMKRAADVLSAEDLTALEGVLKAASGAIAAGVAELGSSADSTPVIGSVDELAKRVRAIQSETPDLSYADAVAKVAAEDPALYDAYRRGE